MKIIYEAEDGTEFDSEKKCRQYENALAASGKVLKVLGVERINVTDIISNWEQLEVVMTPYSDKLLAYEEYHEAIHAITELINKLPDAQRTEIWNAYDAGRRKARKFFTKEGKIE